MPSLVCDSKRFDFHEMLRARKASHLNLVLVGGVPEVPETNIGVLEILVDIGDVRRRANDIVQRSADGLERILDVLAHLLDLGAHR
jgi:hypothetical protein